MKNKKLSLFARIMIGEAIILVVLLFAARLAVFPLLARSGMGHVAAATHAMMIGIISTIFTTLAVFIKRECRSYKKYIAVPAMFTFFGYFLMVLANEVNFIG